VNVKRIAYLPFGGQGITHNGTFWYYSATWWRHYTKRVPQYWREGYIYKMDEAFRIKKHVYSPLLYEYDHIGALDYYNNRLYATLEDRSYIKPRIAVYDNDLKLIETFRVRGQCACPWLAIYNSLLFTSEFTSKSINIYTLDGQYLGSLKLNKRLSRIQGGKFYEDKLYLSCDDPKKSIYKVSLDGSVKLFLNTNIDYEMEDIHISKHGTIYFIDHLGHLYEVLE